jgi:2-C-methyl-D-erythritol 4-phosphate cytidylyltransferase
VDSATGGATRAESVFNGLQHIDAVHGSDWVLVHDAARPCLPLACLSALLEQGLDDPDGALLAVPVADTLKAADAQGHVARTVDRERLWAAQTPQLFPLAVLRDALLEAFQQQRQPTDEAEAMEMAGFHPRLVRGDSCNLKVTWPTDLAIAEALLAVRTVAE